MPQPFNSSSMMMQAQPNSKTSEAIRSLRFNLECQIHERGIKTIAVTSANRGEGKTTTAVNLAIAYAQIGKKVILVDTDLRKPAVHSVFGGSNHIGLTNYLAKQSDILAIQQESYIPHLQYIPAGPSPSNPVELLVSGGIRGLLHQLKEQADMIIVDTAPLLLLTEAKVMATQCDGVLLVMEHAKVKRNIARRVKEELSLARAELLGVVFNKMSKKDEETYFYQ